MLLKRLSSLALLIPLLGGCDFSTDCEEGYRNVEGECVDIDECVEPDPPDRAECGPNGTCLNLPGGYSCSFHHEATESAPAEP